MKKAVDAYGADQDEVDRDNIVLQPRHQKNHRPANEARNGST
jgi:hypothetical protein